MVDVERYRRLVRRPKQLVPFLRDSPLAEALGTGELRLVRSGDLPRDLAL